MRGITPFVFWVLLVTFINVGFGYMVGWDFKALPFALGLATLLIMLGAFLFLR